MSTQKSFIEMERPRRTTEFVVSVKQIEAEQNEGRCELCSGHADWTCMVCGCWTCDLHEDNDLFQGCAMCETCGKLSKEDRQRVYEFREQMNEW